jgi:hypothetical protein
MSDGRDFIERARSIAKNWTGGEMTPDEIVEEFHVYGHVKRAAALDQLDVELADADTSDLRKYARLTSLRRDLGRVHEALRKANR